jgi:hypothetical protein
VIGGSNEFFEDKDDVLNEAKNSDKFSVFGDEGYWHIYGGHRLWISPEAHPQVYYPDNSPIEYELTENGVRLIPPVESFTCIRKEIEITFNDSGIITVCHRVTNENAFDVSFAPWALTVLENGGLQIIPQPKRKSGLLHNRVISLWEYSDMADERVSWGKDYIKLRPNDKAEGPFKLAINNEEGWAAYFNHNNLFVKYYDHKADVLYPDGGVSYETYTNRYMMEMETLGEYRSVAPFETVEHTERWELIPNVAEPKSDLELEQVLEKMIK